MKNINNSEEFIFQEIYAKNSWKSPESVSGPGSSLGVTKKIRQQLPAIFKKLDINVLVDAPCGDNNWFTQMEHDLDLYIGIDIVPEIIASNNNKKLGLNYLFKTGNIIQDILPPSDAIFCRDCLVHMPFDSVFQALKNFKKSGNRFLIMTTFPEKNSNRNAAMGGWRPLNFQIPPFNFDVPIYIMREREYNSADTYNDKSLGVWNLNQIDLEC